MGCGLMCMSAAHFAPVIAPTVHAADECVPFAMLSCAGHTCGLTNWTCSRSWRSLTGILSVHDLQILLQASPCRVLRLLEKGWHLLAPNPLYLCITIFCETLQRESL